MNASDWLPPLVLMTDSQGDWGRYEETLYGWFCRDFVESKPHWPGRRVNLKRHPIIKEKEATFWHFISEGEQEADRTPDLRRCERIRWPRPAMEAFAAAPSGVSANLVWWKTERRGEDRIILALPDFSYIVVVADRGDYVLPWTQYCVEHEHRRKKYQREHRDYWASAKS